MNLSTKGLGTTTGANEPSACVLECNNSSRMKWRGGSTLATFLGAFVLILTMSFAPNAVIGQCPSTAGTFNFPATLHTPTETPETIFSSWGGDYTTFSVVAGETYVFSSCAAEGGNANFDMAFTLYDESNLFGSELAYADIGCGGFGEDWDPARIEWVATFTGTVRLILTEYTCNSNEVGSDYVYFMLPSSGGGPADPCDISVTVSGAGWGDNTTWELLDNDGIVVLSGGPYGNGFSDTQTLTAANNGPYTLGVDAAGGFGDNNADYSVSVGGSVVASGSTGVAGISTETNIAASCSGGGNGGDPTDPCDIVVPACVDTESAEFNTVITADSFCCSDSWDSVCQQAYDDLNPSCTAACADNVVYFDKFDSFGDGWNGATYTITDVNTSSVVASGTLSNPPGDYELELLCLPTGCYEFDLTSGAWPNEIDFVLSGIDVDGFPAVVGGAPANFLFSVGGGSCPVLGCTDPSACNFNSEADIDDGSCTSGIVPDLEFSVTPQCSGFTFNTGNGVQNSVPPTCDPFASPNWFETWGSFTAPASGEVQLFIDIAAASGLLSVELFDDCGADNLGCITAGSGETIVDITVDPNETYLIRISAWSAETSDVFMCFQPVGTFDNATAAEIVPLGDCGASTNTIATISGSNNEAWFEFVAETAGVRIEANSFGSGSADIVLELYEDDGLTQVPGALADATSSGGAEALNFGGLEPGELYKCRISDLSLASGFDDYLMCFQWLPATECDYGSGPYSLCNVFKAKWIGPADYQFTYTNVETGMVDGTFTTSGLTTHLLRQAEGLQWDTEYEVTTNAILELTDGAGSPEFILVENNNGCTIFIEEAPLTKVRDGFGGMSESEPVNYGPFGIVRADFACESTSYTWSFNDGSFLGDGIEYTKFSAGNVLGLGPVGLDAGTYAVRVKATFADGTETEYGATRYISITPATGMATEVESPVVMMDNDKVFGDENFDAAIAIYPNPNRGDNFNLNISGIEAGTDRVMLDVYDLYGKLVISEQLAVGGESLNVVVSLDGIADGMYLVNVIMDGKVYTERMIVQK